MKTTQQIFCTLTEEKHKSYDLAVKKDFLPNLNHVEALQRLEFNQKMQDSETFDCRVRHKSFAELRGGKELVY